MTDPRARLLDAFRKASGPASGGWSFARVFEGCWVCLSRGAGGSISLDSLQAIRRGQGRAGRALDAIVALADAHGVPLTVFAKPIPGTHGLGAEDLAAWYGRRGFRPLEARDGGLEMIRPARAPDHALAGCGADPAEDAPSPGPRR